MTKLITTYSIKYLDEGYFDNNNKIAIHIPIFSNYYDCTSVNFHNEHFFYKCGHNKETGTDIIDNLKILYIDLNDIVFSKQPWQDLKRVQIFTNLNLK